MRLGGPPLPLNDKLGRYKDGYDNTMRTEPRAATMHIRYTSINNMPINNN